MIYIALSLITCRESFNMDRMLHRGPYAVREDQAAIVRDEGKISWAARAIGWDKHFTRGDKWISGSLFAWLMASFVVLAGGTIWNVAVRRWTLPTWSEFWWIYVIVVPLVVGAVAIVWLTWGVMHDLRKIFKVLRHSTHDDTDDGVVEPKSSAGVHSPPSRQRRRGCRGLIRVQRIGPGRARSHGEARQASPAIPDGCPRLRRGVALHTFKRARGSVAIIWKPGSRKQNERTKDDLPQNPPWQRNPPLTQ